MANASNRVRNVLHAAASDLQHLANGRQIDPNTLRMHATALLGLCDIFDINARMVQRFSVLAQLIAVTPERPHGSDVIIYGGRSVAIEYGAWRFDARTQRRAGSNMVIGLTLAEALEQVAAVPAPSPYPADADDTAALLGEHDEQQATDNDLRQIVCQLWPDWEPRWQSWERWWNDHHHAWTYAHRAFASWLVLEIARCALRVPTATEQQS